MCQKTLCCLIAILVSTALCAQSHNAPLDMLIEMYAEALGGRENTSRLQSIKLSGLYSFRGQDQPIVITRSTSGKSKIEITNNDGSNTVTTFNGREVQETRSGETRAATDPRILNFLRTLATPEDAIIDYAAKGHQVKLVGETRVDGVSAYQLAVHFGNGLSETWYIDSGTLLLIKRSAEFAYREEKATQSIYYLDYKPVDGIMIAHYLERSEFHYVHGYEIETADLTFSD